MPDKLAVVSIDAGSNITGKSEEVSDEMGGTSSGKGAFASGMRGVGALVYDSGRAYRTVTLAAAIDGVDPSDIAGVQRKLKEWQLAGRFGHCATGLTLDGKEVDERLLHGEDISSKVALFSPLDSVRSFTKRMKVEWLLDYVSQTDSRLVGFDGREMQHLMTNEVPTILKEDLDREGELDIDLVSSFYMIVDLVEAARRRMAQRGVLESYDDPHWMLHPKLSSTVEELKERAKRDESRELDPVGIPANFCAYWPKDGKLELRARDRLELPNLMRANFPVLFDTTGVGIEEVKRAGLSHIATALQVRGTHPEIAKDLLAKLAS